MAVIARPRRSVLYMPGSNARALEKGRSLPADGLILDLEDAVAPDAKDTARDQIVAALAAGGYGKREIQIRTNGLNTPWGYADIVAAAKTSADAILLPKVESADTVRQVAAIMEAEAAHADMRMNSVENLWEENATILKISTNKAIGLSTYHVMTSDVYPELIQASNASENQGWLKYDMTDKGIRQYIEMADFLLEKKILPRIKQLNSIKTLDESINTKVELNDDLNIYFLNPKGLIFRRTILAKLSGNTYYEDICEYQRSFFSEYEQLAQQKQFEHFKNYPIVFEKPKRNVANPIPKNTKIINGFRPNLSVAL